jgi:hypothetical protein
MKKYILTLEELENEKLSNAENLKNKNDIKAVINDINMFKRFQNDIINIYKKSETQEDIVKALKGKRIMDNDGKVGNGLISLHISYASKVRQVMKTEEEIKKLKESIKKLNNGEQSELTNATINGKKETLKELEYQIKELERATIELKKDVNEKLKEYQNKEKDLKDIRY